MDVLRTTLLSSPSFSAESAFSHLNRSKNGFVDPLKIHNFVKENGFKSDLYTVKIIVKLFDTRFKGNLDFEDFSKIFEFCKEPKPSQKDQIYKPLPKYRRRYGEENRENLEKFKFSKNCQYALSRFFYMTGQFLARFVKDAEARVVLNEANNETFDFLVGGYRSQGLDFNCLKRFFEKTKTVLKVEDVIGILALIDVNKDGKIDENEYVYFLNILRGVETRGAVLRNIEKRVVEDDGRCYDDECGYSEDNFIGENYKAKNRRFFAEENEGYDRIGAGVLTERTLNRERKSPTASYAGCMTDRPKNFNRIDEAGYAGSQTLRSPVAESRNREFGRNITNQFRRKSSRSPAIVENYGRKEKNYGEYTPRNGFFEDKENIRGCSPNSDYPNFQRKNRRNSTSPIPGYRKPTYSKEKCSSTLNLHNQLKQYSKSPSNFDNPLKIRKAENFSNNLRQKIDSNNSPYMGYKRNLPTPSEYSHKSPYIPKDENLAYSPCLKKPELAEASFGPLKSPNTNYNYSTCQSGNEPDRPDISFGIENYPVKNYDEKIEFVGKNEIKGKNEYRENFGFEEKRAIGGYNESRQLKPQTSHREGYYRSTEANPQNCNFIKNKEIFTQNQTTFHSYTPYMQNTQEPNKNFQRKNFSKNTHSQAERISKIRQQSSDKTEKAQNSEEWGPKSEIFNKKEENGPNSVKMIEKVDLKAVGSSKESKSYETRNLSESLKSSHLGERSYPSVQNHVGVGENLKDTIISLATTRISSNTASEEANGRGFRVGESRGNLGRGNYHTAKTRSYSGVSPIVSHFCLMFFLPIFLNFL